MKHLALDQAPYRHSERMLNEVQKTILTEELRTALFLLRDVEIIKMRLKQKFRATNRTHSMEDLSDHENGRKGSGLKKVQSVCPIVRTIVHLLEANHASHWTRLTPRPRPSLLTGLDYYGTSTSILLSTMNPRRYFVDLANRASITINPRSKRMIRATTSPPQLS